MWFNVIFNKTSCETLMGRWPIIKDLLEKILSMYTTILVHTILCCVIFREKQPLSMLTPTGVRVNNSSLATQVNTVNVYSYQDRR